MPFRRGARAQLVDLPPQPLPDPTAITRRLVAEALLLQDEAESVLQDVTHSRPLGSVAPRGGPLVRRFFALADALPDPRGDVRLASLQANLRTIFIHHAMQVATAMDFLAVAGRSEALATQVARIGGLGEPAALLEDAYRQLTATELHALDV